MCAVQTLDGLVCSQHNLNEKAHQFLEESAGTHVAAAMRRDTHNGACESTKVLRSAPLREHNHMCAGGWAQALEDTNRNAAESPLTRCSPTKSANISSSSVETLVAVARRGIGNEQGTFVLWRDDGAVPHAVSNEAHTNRHCSAADSTRPLDVGASSCKPSHRPVGHRGEKSSEEARQLQFSLCIPKFVHDVYKMNLPLRSIKTFNPTQLMSRSRNVSRKQNSKPRCTKTHNLGQPQEKKAM